MSSVNYYEKYLKYKNKYLDLQASIGGAKIGSTLEGKCGQGVNTHLLAQQVSLGPKACKSKIGPCKRSPQRLCSENHSPKDTANELVCKQILRTCKR